MKVRSEGSDFFWEHIEQEVLGRVGQCREQRLSKSFQVPASSAGVFRLWYTGEKKGVLSILSSYGKFSDA